MKQLFWRLTMIFWGLFLVVVVAFGITFYLQYEKNYSRTLLENDQNLAKLGEQVDRDNDLYISLVDSADSMVRSIYQKNQDHYFSLEDEYIKNVGSLEGKEFESQDELERYRLLLAYERTIDQVESTLDQISKVYSLHYRIDSILFIPVNHSFQPEEVIDLTEVVQYSNMMTSYLVSLNKENSQKTWLGVKEVYYGENQKLGDILLVYRGQIPSEFLKNGLENNIYYASGQAYIQNQNLPSELLEQINKLDFESAVKYLSEQNYTVATYESSQEDFSIIHYDSRNSLHDMVLKQTISLFEFSTIVLIVLFLFVSYLLFIAIIRPCYLLIDYVARCGQGDYAIPNQINNAWRSSFLKVRNTYLENERLLAVKDNQSQELELAWKRALVANQTKTHFLAKISHELKTPLNAIKGYIQLLRLSVENPKQLRQIDIIDHSSDLLLKLVNELLEYSVIEDGKVLLDCQSFNIHQTVHVIEELFILEMKSKHLEYSVSADERIPTCLYGDEGRIKQIIINLVSNALKFTETGSVEVRFDLDYQTEKEVYLSIRVKDTGKGIAENKLNAIFESFTQENNTISRQFGGTGLGLSISKRLAEAMSGNLIVESEIDKGSIFTLFIPLSKECNGDED